MAKLFSANRIKTHLVYTVWEVADTLGCHRQTVIRWIKKKGLQADCSRKPWLIEGRVLRTFLGVRRKAHKHVLALHHCFCLGCKAPREADGKIADFKLQTAETGMLTALCPACGAMMHKVMRRRDLEAVRARIEVTIQPADPRLVSSASAPSNVTLSTGANTHGKTLQG
ncbi:MAG: helix-turn-helix domain-containing protein [Thioalkalivibrio sp.]|nr:helix-turn-helix domain-containing protein [Thioalkalivibrio sp.]